MTRGRFIVAAIVVLVLHAYGPATLRAQSASASSADVASLVAAILGETPLLRDLQSLTDGIGGRATGSEANLRSVEWGLERFRAAGVAAQTETFMMPSLWLERSALATVSGEGVRFTPGVAAMPFSAGTAPEGLSRPLLDAGQGTSEDFARLGAAVRDAFLLIETTELVDIAGLFVEYTEGVWIEERAFAAGAAGLVYVGSRPRNMLYRHNCFRCLGNSKTMLVMERDAGLRALRLLRAGVRLDLTASIDVESGPAYESFNVIGEIRGTTKPEEIVITGAHLDSWDLGTGALDNGANVVMMIDIARQMQRLGIRPARTVRFALWNGEEQGLLGSFGYAKSHAHELDDHVMALSVDAGCGRIDGFFTNGRAELIPAVDRALQPVAGLGPFQKINIPIVGTDNYDFMIEGVANLVANHQPATYGPNYHARSDQFHQCDPHQLRVNTAIVAALVYGFADGEVTWARQTRAEIDELMRTTDLPDQMRTFGLWEAWVDGSRGRSR